MTYGLIDIFMSGIDVVKDDKGHSQEDQIFHVYHVLINHFGFYETGLYTSNIHSRGFYLQLLPIHTSP